MPPTVSPLQMPLANLLSDLPAVLAEESFDVLVERAAFRLERIVSTAHATPSGEWLCQPRGEWVVLLAGSAGVRFEDEPQARAMQPGDWLLIAPSRRHRVDWTDADGTTVWLALHFDAAEPQP